LIRAFNAALDALEAVNANELSDGELHHFVIGLQQAASRFTAIRAPHIADWEARRVWDSDGSKAAWGRLARECDLSDATAKAELRRARKLRSMPGTTGAFAEGKLSVDQVDLLTSAYQPDIVPMFERDEQVLLNEMKPLRLYDARRLVDRWIELAYEEVDKERKRPDPAGRHFSAVRTFQGSIDVRGHLDPIGGTEFLEELESIEQELFEAEWAGIREEHGPNALPQHLPRTARQRRADAAVIMARRSRAFRQGKYRLPRPLITVHVGLGTLSRMCELADGTPVSPSQVFPLLTEADIERVVFDGPSRVIDVGVRERFVTGALRRALEVRDRHCQDPSGCDEPAERCQGDHIIPYAEGGLTIQENGRCECAFHNRQRVNRPDERPPPDDTS
jgi:hypothetical protein